MAWPSQSLNLKPLGHGSRGWNGFFSVFHGEFRDLRAVRVPALVLVKR